MFVILYYVYQLQVLKNISQKSIEVKNGMIKIALN